jgi:hypothetical protein
VAQAALARAGPDLGGGRSNAPQPRDQTWCVFAVHLLEVVATKDRGDALGMVGGRPVWKVSAVDDLRHRHELCECAERASHGDLCRVVMEAIEFGLDGLARPGTKRPSLAPERERAGSTLGIR